MFTLANTNTKHSETLKFIAITSMLIDHIGLLFFPDLLILRIIGRIAFPIFAFQIANGYMYTSNRIMYFSRLTTFAAISQIPYMLVLQTYNLNILFTFALSILLFYCINNKKWPGAILIISSVIIPEFTVLPQFEYSWYGVFTPLLFYLFKYSKAKLISVHLVITIVFVTFHHIQSIQYFAVIGVLICLYFPSDKFKIIFNKQFFYWFYPAHLTVLFIILVLFKL